MRLRTASLAFAIAVACTALAWLAVQPFLFPLAEAVSRLAVHGARERQLVLQLQRLLPFYVTGSLVVGASITFVLLHFFVQRPLREMEAGIELLGRTGLDAGPFTSPHRGALVSRVDSALRRLTDALRSEQATTRRQLAALREANERLSRVQLELIAQERLATVGRLAAGVAHEVGNPLAGILGYLSLARVRTQDEQVADFLARIEGEVARIDGIVRSLLDLGRPQRAGVAPLLLRSSAEACVHLVQKGPELQAVEVELEIAPDARVLAEPGALAQILINLLLNAGQAMDGKGTVRLQAELAGERVLLHLDDTGPGIPDDVLPRIFEPFFTTRPPGAGTGLGLAVSQHLASTLGATLTARNRAGGGARFTLSLPRA